jgi:hypothetical protein
LPGHVERAVDQTPPDVAADRRDQELARTCSALLLHDESRGQRERERQDEPRQDFPHPRPRVNGRSNTTEARAGFALDGALP